MVLRIDQETLSLAALNSGMVWNGGAGLAARMCVAQYELIQFSIQMNDCDLIYDYYMLSKCRRLSRPVQD